MYVYNRVRHLNILQIIYTDFNILSPLCVLPSFQIHCTCVETDMRANRMKNRQDQNQREKTKKISKQIKTNIFISFIYVDVNYEGT